MIPFSFQVTASLIKPLLHKLMTISKPVEADPKVIHQAKANLYHDLQNRYAANDSDILDHCSFSDPRTKSLVHLTDQRRERVKNHVLQCIEDTFDDLDSHSETDASLLPNTSSSSTLSSLLGEFKASACSSSASSSNVSQTPAHQELKKYFADEVYIVTLYILVFEIRQAGKRSSVCWQQAAAFRNDGFGRQAV
jgi:serine/threonine protein kinase